MHEWILRKLGYTGSALLVIKNCQAISYNQAQGSTTERTRFFWFSETNYNQSLTKKSSLATKVHSVQWKLSRTHLIVVLGSYDLSQFNLEPVVNEDKTSNIPF